MSYALYALGFAVLIAGLAMAANLLGVAQEWVIVGVIILVGIAILGLANRSPGHD